MSKAFTREDDDLPERPTPVRPRIAPATGVRNPITPQGAQRFREELDGLVSLASAGGEGSEDATIEDRNRRQAIDQRIAELETLLGTSQITPPPPPPWEQVRFGAFVTVRETSGLETTYRIVGMDEADADRDWIGCRSPLAKVLLGATVGQSVSVNVPGGQRVLEIRGIRYS